MTRMTNGDRPTSPPALDSLTAGVQSAAKKGPPPVHLWNPAYCGEIDMRIASDGSWYYMGTPIGRPALVRLFASVLRKDPERYVLVTPVERVGIVVDDAPFVAVEMQVEDHEAGRTLAFRTNVDDWTTADAAHPLRFEREATGGLKPYVLVRGELWARVARACSTISPRSARSATSTASGCSASPRQACSSRWRRRANWPASRVRTECRASQDLTRAGVERLSTVVEQSFTPEALEARALAAYRWPCRTRFSRRPMCPAAATIANPELAPAPGFSLRPGAIHRPAAVLIPVIAREGQATVLLTRRASHLRDHSGPVAFPGGKIDAADASPLHAALREARRRSGSTAASSAPSAILDLYLTGTGFRIAPVLAIVDPGLRPRINPDEVEAAFEVPLAFLMAPENHQRPSREWNGGQRHFYAMPYGEHYIWGVTAGIIRNMYERLYAS